jgi:molecular chaperone DnaK (HSP70)
VIGFATTIVAEMITNRLQASLTRQEFEDTLRQSVDATENAAETAMIAVLHQQIEAWYADISPP